MKTAVKDVMTTRVIWVRKEAPFRELAAALRRHRVSAFPVLGEGDKVIGVVSEADMLAKELPLRLTAGDLMTHPAVTVRPGDSIEHAARLMYNLHPSYPDVDPIVAGPVL